MRVWRASKRRSGRMGERARVFISDLFSFYGVFEGRMGLDNLFAYLYSILFPFLNFYSLVLLIVSLDFNLIADSGFLWDVRW